MGALVMGETEAVTKTDLTGQLLLDNPLLNKGSAFPEHELRRVEIQSVEGPV